jgi:hypothetical protein
MPIRYFFRSVGPVVTGYAKIFYKKDLTNRDFHVIMGVSLGKGYRYYYIYI